MGRNFYIQSKIEMGNHYLEYYESKIEMEY